MVHQQGLHEDRRRHGHQGAQRPQQVGPHDQRDEDDRCVQPHHVARHPRLDDGLEHEVDGPVAHRHDHGDERPLLQQRNQRGRDEAEHEAHVGDVVGDEAEHAPGDGQRDAQGPQEDHVHQCDENAEDRGDQPVGTHAAREVAEGGRRPGTLVGQHAHAGLHAAGVEHQEDQADHQQGQQRGPTRELPCEVAHHAGHLPGLDAREQVLQLGLLHAVARQLGDGLVVQPGALLDVLGHDLHQPQHRPHHRPRNGGEHRVDRDQGGEGRQPPGHLVAAHPGHHRVGRDHQREGQEHRAEHAGLAADARADDDQRRQPDQGHHGVDGGGPRVSSRRLRGCGVGLVGVGKSGAHPVSVRSGGWMRGAPVGGRTPARRRCT